jgi:RNA polymerase sigma-70 factor (ECF subfamily)
MVATDESELGELISNAQRGAGDARGRLLEMYRSYIGILARLQIDRRLQGRVAPSDLVQDTFIEAERNFAGFRGRSEGELIVWLRSVLSTQVARLYRHHTAQQRDFHLEHQLNIEMDQSSQMLQRAFDVKQPSPSHAATRREEVVLLADALELLPRDYREVILLRNLEGLPFEAVAERMGRSVHSVKNLWARALAKLRDSLGTNQ